MQLSLTILVSASLTVNQIITEDLTVIMAGIGKQINTMLSRVEVNASHCPQLTRDLQITRKLPSIDGIHSQLFCSGKFSPFNDKYYVSDSNMQIHDREKWVCRLCIFIFLKLGMSQYATALLCILFLSLKIIEIILIIGLESILVTERK